MKKFLCVSIFTVATSIFASQAPSRLPEVRFDNLRTSNELRRSSDAISILVLKKRSSKEYKAKMSPERVYSSGSSPAGTEYLFPGQTGHGVQKNDLKPVCGSETGFWR